MGREASSIRSRSQADTVALADALAAAGAVVHLHAPDPAARKGDQLNLAASHLAAHVDRGDAADSVFTVCYDADSRPPVDSLDQFAAAIAARPGASVFHQSATFELRTGPREPGRRWQAMGEGAALRANRFVLGFEIPRLRNRQARCPLRRWLGSAVYAHVTGHGLCLRLSLLTDLPFPARSPMEDMHYSFILGSRNIPMIPVPSLDQATVPAGVGQQVRQAARWFFGPGRFGRYLRDPATGAGWRARFLAASACVASLEWLGCGVTPPATVLLLVLVPGPVRWIACLVVATYLGQLLITESALGTPASHRRRAARLLCCPVATVLFGVGGVAGAVQILTGGSGDGKTERL